MTATVTERLQRIELTRRASLEATLLTAYAKRAKWSRTDSARWLDERAPAVNAAALRLSIRLGNVSPHGVHVLPQNPGHAIKAKHPRLFDRLHTTLAAVRSDEARDALLVPDLFR